MKLIIFAFPGMGKTDAFRSAQFLPDYTRVLRYDPDMVIDNDSLLFDHNTKDMTTDEDVRVMADTIVKCRDMAHNVIQFIPYDYRLASALDEKDAMFLVFHPSLEDKDVFLERYRERGDPEAFITLMGQKWDERIQLAKDAWGFRGAMVTELPAGQTLVYAVESFMSGITAAANKVMNSSPTGSFARPTPPAPDPLLKEYPYTWGKYREIMAELITKFRLTDKQIQKRTGINRVQLNKMFQSKDALIATAHWISILKLCREIGCYPCAPKRSSPISVEERAALDRPEGGVNVNRYPETFVNPKPEYKEVTGTPLGFLTGSPAATGGIARTDALEAELKAMGIVCPEQWEGNKQLLIPNNAYGFQQNADGLLTSFMVPSGDPNVPDSTYTLYSESDGTDDNYKDRPVINVALKPVRSVEDRLIEKTSIDGRYFTLGGEVRRNVNTEASRDNIAKTLGLEVPGFEGDTFNTLPPGLDLDRNPEIRDSDSPAVIRHFTAHQQGVPMEQLDHIPMGAYDFKFDKENRLLSFRVASSSMCPKDIIGAYFD